MRFSRGDCLRQFLVKCAQHLFPEGACWSRAMFDEAQQIEDRPERVLWIAGICLALVRLSLRKLITDNGYRPIELTATGAYLFGFSIYVLMHLITELSHGIREPWIQAGIPILLCLAISTVPGICAIALWACDDLGRKLAIGLALLDLGVVITFAHRYGPTDFRFFKFICDLAIIAAMFTSRTKRACDCRPYSEQKLLNLSD